MNNQTKAFIGFGIIAVAVVALVLFLNRKPAEKNLLDINVPKPNVKINGKDVFKEGPVDGVHPVKESVKIVIPKEMVVKNSVGIDGAGICVPCCLETISVASGDGSLKGFAEFCKKKPGGYWEAKLKEMLKEFGQPQSVSVYEPKAFALEAVGHLDAGNPIVAAVIGKLEGYQNKVAIGVIVNGYSFKEAGLHFSYVDTNFPNKQFEVHAKDFPKTDWYVVLNKAKAVSMVADCQCADCQADCACGCKRVHGPMVDDKSFMDLSKDPKFINGISELVAKLVAMLGDAEANAPKWVRVISDRAERTNEQLQMVLYLLGGILAAQVLNGFLVYGNLNALGKK